MKNQGASKSRGLATLTAIALTVGAVGCSKTHVVVPDDAIAFLGRPKGETEDAVMVASADGARTVQVTGTSAGRVGLEWSPDGAHLSFDLGVSGTYVIDPDGSHALSLDEKYHESTSAGAYWSPDGKQLAFTIDNPDSIAGRDVGVLEVARRKLAIVAAGADSPVWSPDGKRLAVRTCSGFDSQESSPCEVSVVNADGTDERQLVKAMKPSGMRWSPDGSRIAYYDQLTNDPGDLTRILGVLSDIGPSDTVAKLTAITNPTTDFASDFAWSRQGNQLAVASSHSQPDGGSFGEVALTDANGSSRRVVSDPTWLNVDGVSWAPDGQSVDLTVDTSKDSVDRKSQHWKVDVGPLTKTRLGNSETCGRRDSSPDGKRIVFQERIVFASECTGEIWTSAPDGSARTRIAALGSSPVWRPKPSTPTSK
jgi:Tol biopolymer transport system component